MKKKLSIIASVVLTIGLAACTVVNVADVGSVNGEKIYLSDFKNNLRSAEAEVKAEVTAPQEGSIWDVEIDGTTAGEKAKTKAFDVSAKFVLQTIKAKEMGIILTEADYKEINESKNGFIKQYGREAFLQMIAEAGYDEKQYDKLQENTKLNSKLKEKAFADITIMPEATDEALKAVFDKDYYKAKHILIRPVADESGNVTDEARATAKAKAEEVKAKLDAGEDFDTLRTEYSSDTQTNEVGGPINQPDGYVFSDESGFVKPFVEAAKLLEIDAVSGLVEVTKEQSGGGYEGFHIIKRIATTEADFTAQKATIQGPFYDELLTKWLGEAAVVKDEARIKGVELTKDPEPTEAPATQEPPTVEEQ